MNKTNENKHVNTENRIVVTRWEGVGGRAKQVKKVNSMVTDGNEISGGKHSGEYNEVEI